MAYRIKPSHLVFALLVFANAVVFQTARAAGPATLRLSASSSTVELGQTFSVLATLNTQGTDIDTVRAEISYPASQLTATSVNLTGPLTSASPGNSLATPGRISWGGFTVSQPVAGAVQFARFNFRADQLGPATIALLAPTRLIREGEEYGNPASYNQVTINVTPSTKTSAELLSLTSPTHPDQTKWYTADTVQFDWKAGEGVRFLSSLDSAEGAQPGQPTDGTTKQYKNVKSGVWYFHLLPQSGEMDVAQYKVQIDNVKPNPIEPYLDISDRQLLNLRFATTDYHSGIASYDVQVNSETTENVQSPFALSGLSVGANRVTITAYDYAGNTRSGWIKFELDADGTVHNITTSAAAASACDLVPGLCAVPAWLYVVVVIAAASLVFLLRRRLNVMNVKTITKTNVGTVSKTITKTDPKTGKKLTTKTVTKTDTKNVVETDAGVVASEELLNNHTDDKAN